MAKKASRTTLHTQVTIATRKLIRQILVFEYIYIYSAPQQPWANRGAFGSISSKKRDKL